MNRESLSPPIPYCRISFVYFTYFAVVGALTPYWSLYLAHLDYTPVAIGAIVSIPMFTKVIAPNIWGWLADKTGKRLWIARLGAAGSTMCFAGLLFSQQTAWFVACIFAYSFFWNAIHAQFEVATLNYLHDKPETYSHVRLWGSIGFVVTVVGLGLAFDYLSVAFLPWFIFLFLSGIFFSSLTLPKLQEKASDRAFSHFIAELKKPYIIGFFIVLFLVQFSLGIYHAFFSIYLESYGYGSGVIGLLWALGATAEILLFVKAPVLLGRFSLRALIGFTIAVTFIRWLITSSMADVLGFMVFAQCLHAFTFGMTHVVAIEFVRREFSNASQSQGQAFYNAIGFGAANALGAIVGGIFFEFSGQLAFVFAAVVVVLSALLHHSVKK